MPRACARLALRVCSWVCAHRPRPLPLFHERQWAPASGPPLPPPPHQVPPGPLWWQGGGDEGKRVGVTTRGIYLLMNGKCRRLRRLQLVTCDLLGYDAVQHMINAPPSAITDLQLRGCKVRRAAATAARGLSGGVRTSAVVCR